MKITKVKWLNHPVLKNIEIDFNNSTNNQPYNNIVFAGENGTGKTSILESLSTFLNIGSFEFFDFIEYTVDGKKYKAVQPANNRSTIKDFFDIVDENGERTHI